jgi:hypothetical protein
MLVAFKSRSRCGFEIGVDEPPVALPADQPRSDDTSLIAAVPSVELRRPRRGGVRSRAPSDPIAQPLRIRLEAQQAGWVGEHRAWVGPRESIAAQQFQKLFGVASAHLGAALALCWACGRNGAIRRSSVQASPG